ncbi:MerR family transcriptional regulator [Streptomyces sp. NPDC088097]|uniref:MerR family transcriptional regulator n=1 Tax=Streptomyces sp. NPDC088097 TaxID=3365823 RepID=UPI00381A3E48
MNSEAEQDGRSDDGVCEGGRYRREDVARAAGVKVRNLRYYQERGRLPPPRREGRIAWYSDDHLTRLRLISDLLGRGYTVNGIGELPAAWEQGGGLSQLLGFKREMTRDWVQEEPVTMTRAELRELFGPQASAEHTRPRSRATYAWTGTGSPIRAGGCWRPRWRWCAKGCPWGRSWTPGTSYRLRRRRRRTGSSHCSGGT